MPNNGNDYGRGTSISLAEIAFNNVDKTFQYQLAVQFNYRAPNCCDKALFIE